MAARFNIQLIVCRLFVQIFKHQTANGEQLRQQLSQRPWHCGSHVDTTTVVGVNKTAIGTDSVTVTAMETAAAKLLVGRPMLAPGG